MASTRTIAGTRLGHCFAIVAVTLGIPVSIAGAQVIPLTTEVVLPPWNAQRVFQPGPLPVLTDPDAREDLDPADTPVKDRLRPGYQPPGIRSGSWIFDPYLSAGGFYDSNVFSSNTNRQSDVAALLGAALRAHTLWERHGIDIRATTLSTTYAGHSGLNQTDGTLDASGRFDIGHSTTLLGAFKTAYLHEGVGTVSSPAGAVEPTPYGLWSGDLTLRREFGRLTASAGGRVDVYNYGSTQAQDGTIINQDARSGPIYTAHARVDYAFSEKFALFTAFEGNRRALEGVPGQPLDSSGYRSLTGFDFELTRLFKGEIAGGYMAQRFTNAAIGTVEGPAYRARLTWSPSRLLDVHFNAEQVATEASDTSVTGVLANAVQLGFDYELRRNVIVSSAATYEKDSFKGEDRSDDVYAVGAQIKYLMNNIGTVALQYQFVRRDSNVPIFSFDKHQVGVNATARF